MIVLLNLRKKMIENILKNLNIKIKLWKIKAYKISTLVIFLVRFF